MTLNEWDLYRRNTARTILARVGALKERMERAQAELEAMRDLASGVKGMDYSRIMATKGCTNVDSIPNAVDGIFAASARWVARIEDYVKEATEVKLAVDELEDQRQRQVLQRVYFDSVKLEDLAAEQGLSYSPQHLRRLHNQALIAAYDAFEARGIVGLPDASD